MELERCREDRSRLKQRVDELERQIIEKDKKLLNCREEAALAKEEASQKTKLCVQLQKQLVDLERTNRSSSKGSLLSGASSTSLMGALLGAASGESQIIARLEKEMAVQQEELLAKIKQNEQLQIRLDEMDQNYENEKKEFGGILEAEVKKAQKLERMLEKKSQELEVVRVQHEAMARDLVEKEKKLFQATTKLDKLEKENAQLKRRIAREDMRNELLKNNKSQTSRKDDDVHELRVETLLTLGDIAFELSETENSMERRSVQSLVDYLNSLSIESLESREEVHSTVQRIAKLCPSNSINSFELFVRAYENTMSDSWVDEFPSKLVKELEFELQKLVEDATPTNSPIFRHVKRLVQMWLLHFNNERELQQKQQQQQEQVKDQSKTQVKEKKAFKEEDDEKDVKEVPSVKQEKSPALQSDESLLNGLEDMIGGADNNNKQQQTFSSKLSTIQEQKSSVENINPPADNLGFNAFKDEEESAIKRHYHMLSLNSLRRVRQLEMELMENEKKLKALEDQILVLKTTASAAEAQRDELKTQAKRDKEELVETRFSYDSQLRSFSDRVMELEKALREKEEEIKQVKGEGLLLQTIRKSLTQKT